MVNLNQQELSALFAQSSDAVVLYLVIAQYKNNKTDLCGPLSYHKLRTLLEGQFTPGIKKRKIHNNQIRWHLSKLEQSGLIRQLDDLVFKLPLSDSSSRGLPIYTQDNTLNNNEKSGVSEKALPEVFQNEEDVINFEQHVSELEGRPEILSSQTLLSSSSHRYIYNNNIIYSKGGECREGGQAVPALNKQINLGNISTSEYAMGEMLMFDIFWAAYPKHDDELRARQIWRAKHLDSKLDIILADLKLRTAWVGDQWTPSPANYLRDERFNDETRGETKDATPRKQTNAERVQELYRDLYEGSIRH